MISGKYAVLESRASCSARSTISDSRQDNNQSEGDAFIKIAFYTSWFVNLMLFSAAFHVLVGTFICESSVDADIFGIFCAFVVFFGALTIVISTFFATGRCAYCVLAAVFALGQFVCVMAYALLISDKPAPAEDVSFVENPLLWAEGHSRVPMAFAIVFLPVFVVQLILLADYTGTRSQDGNSFKKTSRSQVFAVYPGFYLPV